MVCDKDQLELPCILYWISLPEHSDIFTQGYVGITTKPLAKRMQQHIYQAKKSNSHLSNAIKKYGNKLTINPIVIASLGYCLGLENKLRASKNIGYNGLAGGSLNHLTAILRDNDYKQRLATAIESKYKEDPTYAQRAGGSNKGKILSEEHKGKIGKSVSGLFSRWKNPMANKSAWFASGNIYNFLKNNDTKRPIKDTAEVFGIEYQHIKTIVQYIRKGWNPWNDSEWLEFYRNFK